MLTVQILINGEVIHARTVVNRVEETGFYICDEGTKIKHAKEDGAVALAIKALKTIKEVK